MDIEGKKVTIIGGQRSGTALARLVTRLGGQARLSEQGGRETVAGEFLDWVSSQNVSCEFNGHTEGFIAESDFLVLSPGVPFHSPCVAWGRTHNIPVIGEIEFAAQFCAKPIIAVTGSNGKTTVSTLISQVLERAGHPNSLCGNVGHPFSDYVLDLDAKDYVVLELSSFQLESVHEGMSEKAIKGFRPAIAVILNFSQNHLDRHKDLDEYFSAKQRIAINQDEGDTLVLNAKDPMCRQITARSNIIYFNNDDRMPNPNYAAVMSVANILGIEEAVCRRAFEEFKGVEHRLEKVRNISGIEFINDSKATTAQAALWALNSLSRPVVMICGGRDKNIDFSVLADTVQKKVKHMVVIGEAREKIRKAFAHLIDLEECEGMEEAVTRARQVASDGDCVLLSPMCASFDMFKDFEERGRVFKQCVNQLR